LRKQRGYPIKAKQGHDLSGRIILDLSRLLSRAREDVPTGIDRVELAYAQYLLANMPEQVQFGAMHPIGHWGLLPTALARRFVERTARHWAASDITATGARRAASALRTALLLGGMGRLRRRPSRSIYLLTSHHHLNRPRLIESVLERERAALVCLVHDLIPIEFPEYARPGEPERHQQRMHTVARLADGVITNSESTKQALLPYLARAGRAPPVAVAHLGVRRARPEHPTPPSFPVFACIGTIEPRKNHLLLLNLWRRMANEQKLPPQLIIVGRRGWENENIIDMIERCQVLQGVVEERNTMSDDDVRTLLLGARALLLPSFAEGFGLPLAEALALGVPALCSDILTLREVGGNVPEYLDPLDGPAWMRAIADYAQPDSPRRAAQLQRLQHWEAPNWPAHMATAMELIARVATH
jgi:glycosyltransferase involved in cell wall biosynthesis